MTIGEKLKELRVEKRYAVGVLAKESHIGRSTIWKIENNKVKPTIETLAALAKVLGVEVSIFLTEKFPIGNLKEVI